MKINIWVMLKLTNTHTSLLSLLVVFCVHVALLNQLRVVARDCICVVEQNKIPPQEKARAEQGRASVQFSILSEYQVRLTEIMRDSEKDNKALQRSVLSFEALK